MTVEPMTDDERERLKKMADERLIADVTKARADLQRRIADMQTALRALDELLEPMTVDTGLGEKR